MAKKKLDIDALWQVERLGAPSLCPDGAQAVCSSSLCCRASCLVRTHLR